MNIQIKKGNLDTKSEVCALCDREIRYAHYLQYGETDIKGRAPFKCHVTCLEKVVRLMQSNGLKIDVPPYQRKDGIMRNKNVVIGYGQINIKL